MVTSDEIIEDMNNDDGKETTDNLVEDTLKNNAEELPIVSDEKNNAEGLDGIQNANSSFSKQADDKSNKEAGSIASKEIEQKIETKNTPDDADHLGLNSISESLGAFISIAGDKLYETYMGCGQQKEQDYLLNSDWAFVCLKYFN